MLQDVALPVVWSDCLQSQALVQLGGAAGESPRADAHPPVLQTSSLVPQSVYLAYGKAAERIRKRWTYDYIYLGLKGCLIILTGHVL